MFFATDCKNLDFIVTEKLKEPYMQLKTPDLKISFTVLRVYRLNSLISI